MKNINWKIRFKNPVFITGLISGLLLLIKQVAALFGYEFSEVTGEQIMQIVDTVLGILIAVGLVIDPTTKGVVDSERALKYEELGK